MEATTSKITVETTVNAPVAKVWEQFTAPEHITQWCQASEDWHAPFAENDVREGGSFKTTMAAKDGSFSFDFGGVYSEVKENALLDYNMSDGRNVRVLFSSEGDSTKVTEIFDPETTHPIEMQRGGWQAILDSFKKHVESH
jgi:uncharacterized protein YndB with AHSA1/START domain